MAPRKTSNRAKVLAENGVEPKTRSSRRTVAVSGARMQLVGPTGGGTGFVAAASLDHRIPVISNPTPQSITGGNPTTRSRTRYLYQNNAWARGGIDRLADRVVGEGPTPDSGDANLDDLFRRASPGFDARGVLGMGQLLRDDTYKQFCIDGEIFVRLQEPDAIGIDDQGFPIYDDDGLVPLKLLTMSAEWVPEHQTWLGGTLNGRACYSVEGIVLDAKNTDRRIGFWCYDHHPYDVATMAINTSMAQMVDASEVCHLYIPPMPGSLRGQSRVAPVVQRMFRLDGYEDSEANRNEFQSRISTVFTERADKAGEGLLDKTEMTSATGGAGATGGDFDMDEFRKHIDLSGGAGMKLPEGLDAKLLDPKASPAGDDWYSKHQLLAFASCFGLPGYEIAPDYAELSVRVMKFATVVLRMTVNRERGYIEAQVLSKIWKAFVIAAFKSGRWKPAPGKRLQDYFHTAWDWPIIEDAQLSQEIAAWVEACDAGLVDRDYVTKNAIGRDPAQTARKRAEIAARDRAFGFGMAPVAAEPQGSIIIPAWQPDTPLAQDVLDTVAASYGMPGKLPPAVPKPPKPPEPPAPKPDPGAPVPGKPPAGG